MKFSRFLFALAALAMANSGHAAVVTLTVSEFDDVAQLGLDGDLVAAFNLGSSIALEVNSIAFAPGGQITNGSIFGLNYIDATLYDSFAEPIVGLSESDANIFLDSLVYLPGVGNNRWRISDLVVGQEYFIQFLTTDDRFPPATPPTATANYALFPGGPAVGVPVISGRLDGPKIFTGSFIADDSLQDLFLGMTNGGGNNLQMAAYQLRAVPEPAVATLGLMGVAALGTRRRRH